MSVVVLASAKGAPGVSLAAQALAWAWPRDVVLADVDPAGSDVVWRCRDAAGEPLDPDRGLLTLGAAARRGAAETTLAEHLQDTWLGFPVLAGVPSPEQLTGISGVWSQLPAVFDAHPADVLVDVGRVVPGSVTVPLLLRADLVCFVVRPDLEGAAQLRARLRGLSDALRLDEPGARPVAVAVVTSYRDTAVVADLQRLLDSEGLAATVVGLVADDAKGVRVFTASRSGKPQGTLLGRSARTLADALVSELGRTPAAVV